MKLRFPALTWAARLRRADGGDWWRIYSAYLRSPAWRRKRTAVIARQRNRCLGRDGNRLCNNPITEVHHRTYARAGRERLTDLVGFCTRHHEELHDDAPAKDKSYR